MSFISEDESSIDSLIDGSQTSKVLYQTKSNIRHARPAPRPLPSFGSLALPDPDQSHLPHSSMKISQEDPYFLDLDNKENGMRNIHNQTSRPVVGPQHHNAYSYSRNNPPVINPTIGNFHHHHSHHHQQHHSAMDYQPLNARHSFAIPDKELQTSGFPTGTPFQLDHLQQTPTHITAHKHNYPPQTFDTIPQQVGTAVPTTGYLSMPGVNQATKEKLYRDFQTQHEQKQLEQQLRHQLEASKETLIERYVITEERLRQELMDQQKRYEHLLAEKDHSYSLMLDEKDKQYKALKESIEQKQVEHKENLSKKDQVYINQIKEIESKYQEQTQDMLKTHKDQLQKIQHQLKKDEEMKLITDRARFEAKEKEILVKYEKKMKKYAEKIEQVMEQYRLKELKITGALEEARREIIHLQANFDAKEQSYREELMLKDRRLIQIQQRLDTVDDLAKVADTWRETAKDLASIVIRTCATVEDLPPELWSSTTPGLFTTVWDDLQHLKASHASSTTEKLPRNDDIAETYAKKRKEYVMASRVLMSKCLRFSKSIHERIKAEVVVSSPPPKHTFS